MPSTTDSTSETRRGEAPAAEAYLKRVGERVRLGRARRGMSRKVLSAASGVSERYLAELERGAGNASLLVLRQIADALGLEAAQLVSDQARAADRPHLGGAPAGAPVAGGARRGAPAAGAALRQGGRLGARAAWRSSACAAPARRRSASAPPRRSGCPFVELDREVERASGMELSEIFATHGQAMYRRLERQCLETVIERFDRAVIATGGSLVTEPATYDLLLSSCFVVWLSASRTSTWAASWRKATCGRWPKARRPWTISRPSWRAARALYAKADAEVSTSDRSEGQALAALLAAIARAGPAAYAAS